MTKLIVITPLFFFIKSRLESPLVGWGERVTGEDWEEVGVLLGHRPCSVFPSVSVASTNIFTL